MIGLYTHRDSAIHQFSAGIKLAGLLALSLVLAVFPTAAWLISCAVAVFGVWLMAKLPLRALAADLKPVVWVILAVAVFHMLFGQASQGAIVAGRLLILIAAAMLVTRTTPLTDMLATLERVAQPFNWVGIEPARMAFLIVLVIRMVPVIVAIVSQGREAARARGAKRSLKALFLSVASRTVLFAGQMGEALDARSPGGPRR